MHSRIKFGGLTLGTGVLVGLGIVGWMRAYPAEAPVASSSGGSVVLDANTSPSPAASPADTLSVVGSDNAQTLGAGSLNAARPSATAAPSAASAPGPADFKQYDQYLKSTAALFGDLLVGQGQEVAVGSTVSVAYRGWLTNGTLFDESYSSGKAFSFKEGDHRVIPGWEQGILGMKVGGKRRLIVPPGQGYGADAHGPIPGGSVLVFDVELLGVQ